MKVDLISFQDKAVKDLRVDIADALDNYRKRGKTQVVSLQAPTGAGKTIIAAALIEGIYNGMSFPDGTAYAEQPDAIFVWLSDSPELNLQSKEKIELKTSKLRYGQCVTISEESFDMEMLEDGHIYFLNTQKISRSGKLTTLSDNRQYTIWETLNNTIENKSDRLYFIIDEAHRGAKSKKESGTDTTIMQRFIKGYDYTIDGIKHSMKSMPVVLGISATAERFNTLISNISNVSLSMKTVTADEVRSSGLLKDRIVITYPDDVNKNNDIVLLDAAVEEWQKKCLRWHQYTSEQHYANVDPVLVVQVCKGTNGAISDTNLEDIVEKIEQKLGKAFKPSEIVHCFGDIAKLEINGLSIPYVKASEIADDHRIKVVLFKEALSTGWDCPRAETMMSFATRTDPTYIAQLLGRMVRTPLQMRVKRDEFLNDVKLYLPHFDKDTVKKVIDELQSNEGGEIPTSINGESLAEPEYVTWTVHTPRRSSSVSNNPDQYTFTNNGGITTGYTAPVPSSDTESEPAVTTKTPGEDAPEYLPPTTVTVPYNPPINNEQNNDDQTKPDQGEQLKLLPDIDRVEIINEINNQGFLTYMVRKDRIHDYLKSLQDLADLLTHYAIYQGAIDEVVDDVVGFIRSYVDDLHNNGQYDELAKNVLEFKLEVQIFDPFGKVYEKDYDNLTLFSESDIDRQLRNANARLGNFGFPNYYGGRYYDEDNPNQYKIDCILYAVDDNCRAKLGEYARKKFTDYINKYRLAFTRQSDSIKNKYRAISADSDIVSKQIFSIPEDVSVKEAPDGIVYDNHLLASEETGLAKIKLNNWEAQLIAEESKRSDFVCWLRMPERASWSLCLPYEKGGETKSFYPDFLIIRYDSSIGYIVDVLEPHGQQYADNLPKAKALANYTKDEDGFGRVQLIHMGTDSLGKQRFQRLELTDISIRDKVLRANTDDELTNIFITEGIFD